MKMENIVIMVKRDNYIVVIATTERFGREVMFEGNTFTQCFNYLKRELGVDRLVLRAGMGADVYEDREGRWFPALMHCVN